MTSFVLLTEDNQAVYLVQLLNALNNPAEAKRQREALQSAKTKDPNTATDDIEASETKIALASQIGRYVAKEQYYELVEYGFFPSIKTIMAAPPGEIDTAFTLVFSLLPRLQGANAVQSVINKLAEFLSSDHQKHPALKLRLLAILFNLLGPGSIIRHNILMSIFDLALSSRRPKLPLTFVKPLDDWIKVWSRNSSQFPPSKVASTYLKVAQLAEAAKDMKKRHDFMYKYMKALDKLLERGKMDDSNLVHIAAAVVEAIKVAGGPNSATVVTDCGRLVEMTSVKALSRSAKYKTLFKLLKIFAFEPVDEYMKFYEKNKSFMAEFGLNHEDTLCRLRTLTLCDLGMVHESLTFEEIAEKLLIEGGDDVIEEAILNAVVAKKIEAKIDEEERKVIILRASWRSFRTDDWRFLSEKLKNWQTALNGVISETFKNQGMQEQYDQ